MKTMTILIMTFIGLLSFSSCENNSDADVCNCESDSSIADNQLHGKWKLESFKTLSGKKDNVPSGLEEMYIIFSDSVNAQVKGQNNTCIGQYQTFVNYCIKFHLLFCTKVGGTKEQLEWEDRYFNALNNAQCYKISGSSLKIYYRDNVKQKIMNFIK